MKIHVVHSKDYDYQNELYLPLRNSPLSNQHQIFLPYELDEFAMTKDLIRDCDMVLAEVSYPSTGLGIELGWADSFGKPIICVSKTGVKVSSSLKTISEVFIEYSTPDELIIKISEAISNGKL